MKEEYFPSKRRYPKLKLTFNVRPGSLRARKLSLLSYLRLKLADTTETK